jgi:hypothetical protein
MSERGYRGSTSLLKTKSMRASDKRQGYYVGRIRKVRLTTWKKDLERMGLKSGIKGNVVYKYYRGKKSRSSKI